MRLGARFGHVEVGLEPAHGLASRCDANRRTPGRGASAGGRSSTDAAQQSEPLTPREVRVRRRGSVGGSSPARGGRRPSRIGAAPLTRTLARVRVQVGAGAGHVRPEPRAVRRWHHPVLAALPHGDRYVDCGQVEAPRADEREVVVAPARDTRGNRRAEGGREGIGERAGKRVDVDRRTKPPSAVATSPPVTVVRPADSRSRYAVSASRRHGRPNSATFSGPMPANHPAHRRRRALRRPGSPPRRSARATVPAHASACGPPPDQPSVTNRSYPSRSSTTATSPAASATLRPGRGVRAGVPGPPQITVRRPRLAAGPVSAGTSTGPAGVPRCSTSACPSTGPTTSTSSHRPSSSSMSMAPMLPRSARATTAWFVSSSPRPGRSSSTSRPTLPTGVEELVRQRAERQAAPEIA